VKPSARRWNPRLVFGAIVAALLLCIPIAAAP